MGRALLFPGDGPSSIPLPKMSFWQVESGLQGRQNREWTKEGPEKLRMTGDGLERDLYSE